MGRKRWYPVENGKSVIEIKIASLEQLFDKRDPNPYRTKDLDEDVEDYIFSSAQEIGLHRIGKLKLICSNPLSQDLKMTASMAIRDHFLYRKEMTEKKVRTILSLGVKTLFIGLLFLSMAIAVSATLSPDFTRTFMGKFIKEGLILIGWVSMWKPVNIFLYEWWPLIDQRKIYEKLNLIDIDITEYRN